MSCENHFQYISFEYCCTTQNTVRERRISLEDSYISVSGAGSRVAMFEGSARAVDAAARGETRTVLVYISMSIRWLEVRVRVLDVG